MAKYDIVIKGGTVIDGPGDQHDRPRPGAPFVEDSVDDLARYLPVERILFGSDWPHAEGLRQPKDFLAKIKLFPAAAQRRIMVDNARELTFAS